MASCSSEYKEAQIGLAGSCFLFYHCVGWFDFSVEDRRHIFQHHHRHENGMHHQMWCQEHMISQKKRKQWQIHA